MEGRKRVIEQLHFFQKERRKFISSLCGENRGRRPNPHDSGEILERCEVDNNELSYRDDFSTDSQVINSDEERRESNEEEDGGEGSDEEEDGGEGSDEEEDGREGSDEEEDGGEGSDEEEDGGGPDDARRRIQHSFDEYSHGISRYKFIHYSKATYSGIQNNFKISDTSEYRLQDILMGILAIRQRHWNTTGDCMSSETLNLIVRGFGLSAHDHNSGFLRTNTTYKSNQLLFSVIYRMNKSLPLFDVPQMRMWKFHLCGTK